MPQDYRRRRGGAKKKSTATTPVRRNSVPLMYRPLERYEGYVPPRRRNNKIPLNLELALDQTPDDPADYILDFT